MTKMFRVQYGTPHPVAVTADSRDSANDEDLRLQSEPIRTTLPLAAILLYWIKMSVIR
jgi:hypothetical protein